MKIVQSIVNCELFTKIAIQFKSIEHLLKAPINLARNQKNFKRFLFLKMPLAVVNLQLTASE